MNNQTSVKRISPMLAVADMDVSVAFYRDVLGLSVIMLVPGYAIVERDGATIHLSGQVSEEIMALVRGNVEIYIEVTTIASLWEHVKAYKDSYRIQDLFDQPYGMTEFHIDDPNDCLVFVGEPTATS
jgi:catechol 2,3-dioxygenase-like lactoylglutathione lyase family enzyme